RRLHCRGVAWRFNLLPGGIERRAVPSGRWVLVGYTTRQRPRHLAAEPRCRRRLGSVVSDEPGGQRDLRLARSLSAPGRRGQLSRRRRCPAQWSVGLLCADPGFGWWFI